MAYLVYVKEIKLGSSTVNKWLKENLVTLYQLSLNKWYIDEIYNAILAVLMGFFRTSWKLFERVIIEGIVINGLAWRGTEVVGEVLKTQQSGKIQNYVLIMISSLILGISLLVLGEYLIDFLYKFRYLLILGIGLLVRYTILK
jgi:NADH:ubiquinone oxidoreductase subunit 5 (subunit L)/multisubunit Na+/H+ antiporter MnhA subunit